MCNYLKDRRQAGQINNNFSPYKKVQAGVPQESIDGPFFLSNYADDNDLYSTGQELVKIKEKLRKDFKVVTGCFFA